jgi:hypothetical protein
MNLLPRSWSAYPFNAFVAEGDCTRQNTSLFIDITNEGVHLLVYGSNWSM